MELSKRTKEIVPVTTVESLSKNTVQSLLFCSFTWQTGDFTQTFNWFHLWIDWWAKSKDHSKFATLLLWLLWKLPPKWSYKPVSSPVRFILNWYCKILYRALSKFTLKSKRFRCM